MSVLDAIKGRFSVRHYLPEPVSENDLNTIIEAARFSQSAKNLQDWKFIVVRDEKMRQKLSVAAKGQSFVAQAPVVIACCGTGIDYVMTCGQHAYNLDVAIAMENMALTAYELGLGTCWLGAFYEDQIKIVLSIPEDDVRVVGLLTIGRPSDQRPEKRRKKLDEIVRYETW
ncbi:MAG: nitroreductase [Candidatus Latescibacteria bacterium]|jgi:nitroreductase|nr:nitroreductase [Candidatus Latescibacterota bacterium]